MKHNTGISSRAASMLTLDSTTDELQDHISVLDQGVDKSTNMWLEFGEDPAVVSLSVIIEENLEKLTTPIAGDAIDLPSSDTTISAPAAAPIPTLTEAFTQCSCSES